MATPESKSSFQVRSRASDWGIRLFRNNSGVLMNEVGVPVRFGLGNESKDLNETLKTGDFIGWTPVTITADMVGKQLAVFTNFECKPFNFAEKKTYNKKTREYGQDKFNTMVNNAGGIVGFTSCTADVDRLIQEFINNVRR